MQAKSPQVFKSLFVFPLCLLRALVVRKVTPTEAAPGKKKYILTPSACTRGYNLPGIQNSNPFRALPRLHAGCCC